MAENLHSGKMISDVIRYKSVTFHEENMSYDCDRRTKKYTDRSNLLRHKRSLIQETDMSVKLVANVLKYVTKKNQIASRRNGTAF